MHAQAPFFSSSTQHEGGFIHTYTLDNPQPGTFYEFQVRCACSIGLTSDWSAIQKLKSAETGEFSLVMWLSTGKELGKD